MTREHSDSRYIWDDKTEQWEEYTGTEEWKDDDDEGGEGEAGGGKGGWQAKRDAKRKEAAAKAKAAQGQTNGAGPEEGAGAGSGAGDVETKKRKRNKKKKKNAWSDKGKNSWVYVSGLPGDTTEAELKEHFCKCGVLGECVRLGLGYG